MMEICGMSKRKVQGYSFAEFGVEWGYECCEDGTEKIYVLDVIGVRYVDTEEQAEQISRESVEHWSPC